MVLSLAACSAPVVVIYESEQGTKIQIISEQPESPNGIDPRFKNFAALDIEASLRRITITHSTWISLVQSDPKPLFSRELILELRDPLAKHLKLLKNGERIFIQFKDPYKFYDVDVAIYPDGSELVYYFTALIRNRDDVRYNELANDQGILVAQPGQTVDPSPYANLLRESIIPDEFQRAGIVDRIKTKIDTSFDDKLIDSTEYEQLTEIAESPRVASENTWELFWERWVLLKKAHEQRLMDDKAYREQKVVLIAEIQK